MSGNTDEGDAAIVSRLIGMGATDLTARAKQGQVPRAYGREAEVTKVFECLAARRSLLLLGPANVGKTAILHEVISRVFRHQAPAVLQNLRFIAISTGAVMVGTKYLGEWQTRLGELLENFKKSKNLVLYLEDIWALRDAGRASEKTDGFSTFIRPYLEHGEIVIVGESTPENYHSGSYGSRALADDQSLMKYINVISIEEPGRDATKSILAAVSRDLQREHKVRIEATALERALELTRRFLPYQAFPGKATQLLEEAAQDHKEGERIRQQPAGELLVTSDVVSATFAHMTGLPEKIISDTIPLRQEDIRSYFDERVVGQKEAVDAIVDVVTLVKAELNDPGRPLGVLFFVGPTGVGKTELAKTLAEYLFGSKEKLIRLDMSEYTMPMSVPDLLAQLTERQRKQSFSVLLLDEIEKASPYIFDLFLQVFDDARLTDADGRSVDLHNTIIIMTSNIGTHGSQSHGIGFLGADDNDESHARSVQSAVEEYFRPEFINRLDKIVIFQPLGQDEMRRIARRELGKALLREGVLRRNILLDFREEVLDALLKQGFSAAYGARPLQRAIKELVLLPLARRIALQPSTGEQLLELCVVDGKIDAAIIPVNEVAEVEREPLPPHERTTLTDAASGRVHTVDLRQLQDAVVALRERIEEQISGPRYQGLQNRATDLLAETGKPSFWDDNDRAREILSTIYQIERVTSHLVNLRSRAEQLTEVATMIRRHKDVPGLAQLASNYEALERAVALAELELFAGDGDTLAADMVFLMTAPVSMPRARDAGDWPEMLAVMYMKWAGRKGHDVAAIQEPGMNPILLVRGPNIGAILRGEEGLHKLQHDDGVPRKKDRGRATTRVQLARVDVLLASGDVSVPPAAGDVSIAEIIRDAKDAKDVKDPKEPRDQRDNRSALLEARHERSGLSVRVQSSEEVARGLLRALLVRQESGIPPGDELVRVYHLAKAQYVRDPRTGVRSTRARDVLDGALDAFLLAYLKQKADVVNRQSEEVEGNADSSRQVGQAPSEDGSE
ncbi:MAG: AAA family ATPase [Ktedonobacterales bacterium]